MRPLSETEVSILERFERLPDSAAAPLKICALVSGISERTWRRSPHPRSNVREMIYLGRVGSGNAER